MILHSSFKSKNKIGKSELKWKWYFPFFHYSYVSFANSFLEKIGTSQIEKVRDIKDKPHV